MKNKLSLLALTFFICRANFITITSYFLTNISKQDAWLNILLSIVISIPYVILITKKNNYNIFNNKLSKIILLCITFIYTIISFYSLSSLISIQYLYNTPKIVTTIGLIIPIYFLSSKNNNTFILVINILFYISIILYILSITGLIDKIHISNIEPILENKKMSIIYYISYNIIPLYTILLFKEKLNNSFLKAYLISNGLIFIMFFLMISILGIDLILLFKYPDYFILKFVYNGIINFRLQNLLGIQYIIDGIIYISINIKFINKIINKKYNIVLSILLIIITYIITIYNLYIYNTLVTSFAYISTISIIYILIKKTNSTRKLV